MFQYLHSLLTSASVSYACNPDPCVVCAASSVYVTCCSLYGAFSQHEWTYSCQVALPQILSVLARVRSQTGQTARELKIRLAGMVCSRLDSALGISWVIGLSAFALQHRISLSVLSLCILFGLSLCSLYPLVECSICMLYVLSQLLVDLSTPAFFERTLLSALLGCIMYHSVLSSLSFHAHCTLSCRILTHLGTLSMLTKHTAPAQWSVCPSKSPNVLVNRRVSTHLCHLTLVHRNTADCSSWPQSTTRSPSLLASELEVPPCYWQVAPPRQH